MKAEDLIIVKTVTELMDAAKTNLTALEFKVTNWRAGGVFQTLLEISSQGLADLYTLLRDLVGQNFVGSATGDWLDLKAAETETYRLLAEKAQGNVVFKREVTGSNVIIPEGAIVSTPVDSQGNSYRYFVIKQAVMDSVTAELAVLVEAEFAGAEYNVGAGQVTSIITYIAGIDSVNNLSDWLVTPGTDDEDDESLRLRSKNKWYQLSSGGTRESYINWAQEITGVMVVQVDDEHPRGQGSVDVIITSASGIPSAELISQVQDHLNIKKPLCSNVLVVAPTPITVNWDVMLYVNKEHGELADIESQGAEIIDIMYRYGETDHPEIKKISPTQGVIRAQAISNLMTIDYVENVVITAPAADVAGASRGLVVKGTVNVTAVRLS